MASYSITTAVAEAQVTNFSAQLGGTSVTNFYSGTMPTNANTALSGNTLLASLPNSATAIGGTLSDTGTAGRGTWNAITSVAAVATGTASFFRTLTGAGTVIDQGDVATSGAACTVSTVAFTAGSTISISSRTSDQPYGP
jgi:hypothetical protein